MLDLEVNGLSLLATLQVPPVAGALSLLTPCRDILGLGSLLHENCHFGCVETVKNQTA